jgi:DNA-3-methyladenine glycosylase II
MPVNKARSHLLAALEPTLPKVAAYIAGRPPLWFGAKPAMPPLYYLSAVVVNQLISSKAADTIWARIEAAAEKAGGLEQFLVPERQALLRSCGLSGAKTRTLLGLGQAARDGWLAGVFSTQDEKIRRQSLKSLWGIGDWSCDMLALFYFHDEDVMPLGDASVQRALWLLEGIDPKDRERQGALTAPAAPWRSILCLYLWNYLDNPPLKDPA